LAQGAVRSFYSESDINDIFSGSNEHAEQNAEEGFLFRDGVRYGSCFLWSKTLGIGNNTMDYRLKKLGEIYMLVKVAGGHVLKCYAENDVRRACADLLVSEPSLNRDGFVRIKNVTYGLTSACARKLELSWSLVKRRVEDAGIESISAKSANGRISNVYPYNEVLRACSDLLGCPEADSDGFFEKDENVYGSADAWRKHFQLSPAIFKRLKKLEGKSILGKSTNGKVYKYYTENDVRSVCADLLEDNLPQANENGFYIEDNKRFATIAKWARELRFYHRTIKVKLEAAKIPQLRGKDSEGKVRFFYAEADVRRVCSSIKKRKPKKR
jgi:hypothetical protein